MNAIKIFPEPGENFFRCPKCNSLLSIEISTYEFNNIKDKRVVNKQIICDSCGKRIPIAFKSRVSLQKLDKRLLLEEDYVLY